MSKSWQASMPSNIAWIKYMGKKDHSKNVPTNPSLSWTLPHLLTEVKMSIADRDDWKALVSDYPFAMSEKGKEKYLNHLKRMKDSFGVRENFLVESANNFPADCGIASSASSFAALTEVCSIAFAELTGKTLNIDEKCRLSAEGSGSSCRSFFEGLVVWDETGVFNVEKAPWSLTHMVILIGEGSKEVSSSEAHKRVASSDLFPGRVERSLDRLSQVKKSLRSSDWKSLYEILWTEFWDMHALFETCHPPFGYFLPGTMELLSKVRAFWSENHDGPLVTMDAGPNIHLLWRENQKSLALDFFNKEIKQKWTCLSDIQEIGFAQI